MPSDWLRDFAPETPLLELVARGAILYFGILILMRVMLRRSVSDWRFVAYRMEELIRC